MKKCWLGVLTLAIVTAFNKIETQRAPFISRGDKGGTHAAELCDWVIPMQGVKPFL